MQEQRFAETPSLPPPVPLASQSQQPAKEKPAPSPTTQHTAPGWYPDPLQERLWDGEAWTETVRPVSARSSNEESMSPSDKRKPKANRGSAKEIGLPSKVLLEGLDYGTSFEEGSSCYNCGHRYKVTVAACSTCGVNY